MKLIASFCMMVVLLALWLCCAMAAVAPDLVTLTPEQCLDFGFDPSVLRCDTCTSVVDIMGEASVASRNCLACCNEESTVTYARAVLELDKRSLSFYPELQAVLDRKKELKLTVRNRAGSAKLLMFREKEDKEPAEVLAVDAWHRDTFADFLQSHLSENKGNGGKSS